MARKDGAGAEGVALDSLGLPWHIPLSDGWSPLSSRVGMSSTMGGSRRWPGLLVGPHIEEVLSGADLTDFRARLTDGGALALFDYWCGLLRAHGLAMKAAFDPTRIPRALANIYLEEYDAERQQSRMRLMGETLKAQWRDSVVGLCTDDYVSGSVAELWKQSDAVVYFERRAAILTYNLEYIDRAHVTLIDLALPLDDEHGKKFAIGCAWRAA